MSLGEPRGVVVVVVGGEEGVGCPSFERGPVVVVVVVVVVLLVSGGTSPTVEVALGFLLIDEDKPVKKLMELFLAAEIGLLEGEPRSEEELFLLFLELIVLLLLLLLLLLSLLLLLLLLSDVVSGLLSLADLIWLSLEHIEKGNDIRIVCCYPNVFYKN